MGRFTFVVDDQLDMEFRIEAVKRRMKLNEAFKEAMQLWILNKECGKAENS